MTRGHEAVPASTSTWDDELEELTEKALAAFGDEAVGSAFVRALALAPVLDPLPAFVKQLLSRCELGPSKCVDASTSVQCFKAELRRMLTEH
jgi:hypothetical protein